MQPGTEGRVELEPDESPTGHLIDLVREGRRIVRIFSDDLDPDIFADAGLAEALSEFARLNRRSEVRILIKNSEYLVGRSHDITNLNRRIPSLVAIRKLTYAPELYIDNYLLVDDHGLYYDPKDENQIRFINANDRPMVKHLSLQFDELWAKSHEDPELRSL